MKVADALRRLSAEAGLDRLRYRLARSRTAARVWDERARTLPTAGARHWTELKQVRDAVNRRVSGDPAVDPYQHFMSTRLEGRLPVGRALTVGCGHGELERGLCQFGFALRHEAFDVSPEAIGRAVVAAEASGLGHLRYSVADANDMKLEPEAYDVVFGVHSIHHVSRLEHALGEISRALKPDGFLFLNEFVGPTRFQWTERQLEVVNGLLRVLPEARRVAAPDGRIKRRVRRPTVTEAIATDPSEAVRSSEITGLVASLFEVVEVRPYGGTVLHLLLDDIAGNFERPDGEACPLLEALCALEWALVQSGDLASDFAVVVAKPRTRRTG